MSILHSKSSWFRRGSVIATSLALAGLMIVPLSTSASAADCGSDTLSKAQAASYIRMSSYQQPPHGWFDINTGKYSGIDVEIITKVLNGLGIKDWDYVTADWGAMIPGLNACRWDIMSLGMTYTKLRSEMVQFSTPVYMYGQAMLVAKGNPKKIYGKPQWKGKKVGGIVGATDDQVVAGVKGAIYVPFVKYADIYRALATGRIDASMIDELQVQADFKKVPQPKIDIIKEWVGKDLGVSSIVMRKGDTALGAAVNAQLKIMQDDGSLKAILLKYGMPKSAYVTCLVPTNFTKDGIAQCLP
jgi:polar amino acid transport system substrate-binding protein